MSDCRLYPQVECAGPGGTAFGSCPSCPGPVDMSDKGWREQRESKPGRKTVLGFPARVTDAIPKDEIRIEVGGKTVGAIKVVEMKPAAAPAPREEEKTMARTEKGVPMQVGECPYCHKKDVPLKVSDTFFGGGRGCKLCYKRAQNAAGRAAKVAGKGEKAPAKPAAAPRATKTGKPGNGAGPADKSIHKALVDIGGHLGRAATEAALRTGKAPVFDSAYVPMTARSLADALQAEEVVLRVTCRSVAAVLAVVRAVEDDRDVMIGVGAKG